MIPLTVFHGYLIVFLKTGVSKQIKYTYSLIELDYSEKACETFMSMAVALMSSQDLAAQSLYRTEPLNIQSLLGKTQDTPPHQRELKEAGGCWGRGHYSL